MPTLRSPPDNKKTGREGRIQDVATSTRTAFGCSCYAASQIMTAGIAGKLDSIRRSGRTNGYLPGE
jgi:hypothetical protein